MARTSEMGEDRLIEWIRKLTEGSAFPGEILLGIGDDAASIRPAGDEEFVITTDIQVEGVHFERTWLTSYELGRRAAAVGVSDIAAMGARPVAALLSLAFPSSVDGKHLKRLIRGAVEELGRRGAALVGGNVSRAEKHLTLDMTVVGSCRRGEAWRRSCKPGDAVVLAGELGCARAGLLLLKSSWKGGRYRTLVHSFTRPEPRVDVALMLSGEGCVHGAIDVSDGLSTDLLRLCKAAGVGCEIDGGAIPLSRNLAAFLRERSEDPVRFMLAGGEDYALVLAVDGNEASRTARRVESRLGIPCRVIGRFTRGGKCEVAIGRKRIPLSPGGWDHLLR